jgi:hypothetical protein
MFVFVWFFIPETKGISLERMDELFGAEKKMEIEDLAVVARERRQLGGMTLKEREVADEQIEHVA